MTDTERNIRLAIACEEEADWAENIMAAAFPEGEAKDGWLEVAAKARAMAAELRAAC